MSIDIIYHYWLPLLAGLTGTFIVLGIYRAFYISTQTGGRVIPEQQLAGRKKELTRLVRQILRGQSAAIISPFSDDRTKLLDYLRSENPEHRTNLYGDKANRLIFPYLDISTLEEQCSPALFWEEALKPVEDKIIAGETSDALSQAYKTFQDKKFDYFYLDKLFAQMRVDDWQLVLMLDRFDLLQHCPLLYTQKFLGSLRTLASSRSDTPLTLVISGNIPLNQIHKEFKEYFNSKGSPFLNFIEPGEITLGALSETEIDELLNQAEHKFDDGERRFLKEMTGGHPYLLGYAATLLWDAHENKEPNPIQSTEKAFSDRVKGMLNNIVQSWHPNICKAFCLVVQKRDDVSHFKNELADLEKQGFVIQDKESGEWRIRARVFADFVTDKTEQELCEK
jgi:hypothetical protein